MQHGVSAGPIDLSLPYAQIINSVCEEENFPTPLAYAIAWRETIQGEVNGSWNAATVVSFDNGRGLFQLTYSAPSNWKDPRANCKYAIDYFLKDNFAMFARRGLEGDDLVKVTAAAFNAGAASAWNAHLAGNVDKVTTDNYGAAVLSIYHNLLLHRKPGA